MKHLADSKPSSAKPAEQRLTTILVQSILLALLLVAFRITKERILHLDASLLDWLVLLLPEVGSVALLEGLFVVTATRLRSRTAVVVWWTSFGVVHFLAYALIVLEHTFFLHSGIRLDLDLVGYALDNFMMLQGMIAYGVDHGFVIRVVVALSFLVLGTLVGLRACLPIPEQALPVTVLGCMALLVIPPTTAVRNAGLATTTLGGFLRSKPGFDTEAQKAQEALPPPAELYTAPRLLGPPERTPNVLLLILESTRTDVTPPYAPEDFWHRTPALSRLADESLVVDHAYSTVTHTSKALTGILCGMYPRQAMRILESLEDSLQLPCLPHLLAEAGYRTAFMQTAYGRFENRPGLIRNMGFEQAAFQETLRRPGFGTTGYLGLDEMAMVDPAVGWLDQGGPEPFFLTLLTLSTHHPYQVPGQPVTTDVAEHHARYIEAIEHQDRVVAALLDRLEETGHMDDTVLVVLGDHGEAFGEHRRLQHDIVPYEEVVHVPLLIHAPALLGPSRHISGLRHQVDLLPTLLDLLGVPWQGKLPGRDILETPGHERVYSSCWFANTCLAMREGDRKWVFHYGLRPTEAFDLATDPGETHNLAPALSPETIHAAEQKILEFRLSVDAWWAEHPAQTSGPERWWQEAPPPAP
ncbi:MAG: LTA synthase family protein [Acidobacteria bacterium]|nr:LTA synthase family protein [Acidobacteriota bacterium]